MEVQVNASKLSAHGHKANVRPRANLSPGKHLAVASAGEATQLNVVVNWLQELRQRVPTK